MLREKRIKQMAFRFTKKEQKLIKLFAEALDTSQASLIIHALTELVITETGLDMDKQSQDVFDYLEGMANAHKDQA